MGRIIFVYVNGMINALPGEKLKLFADDTGLFVSGVDISVLNHNCNCHMNALNRWFIANRLHLNVQKTNVMVFPKSNADNICVTLGHITIERVHTYRYLGVIIDDQPNWYNHIEYIYNKLMKHVGIFYKIRGNFLLLY